MLYLRTWLVEDAPTPEPHSPAEVEIFVVHEVASIENPDVGERASLEERSRPAKAEHLAALTVVGGWLVYASVTSATVTEQQEAGILDAAGAVGPGQAAGDRPHPRDRRAGVNQGLEPARVDPCVVVQEHYLLTASVPDAEVVAAGKSEISRRQDHPDPWQPARQRRRSILGVIVNHQNFEVSVQLLVQHRAHAIAEVVGAVEVQDDDADGRVRSQERLPSRLGDSSHR